MCATRVHFLVCYLIQLEACVCLTTHCCKALLAAMVALMIYGLFMQPTPLLWNGPHNHACFILLDDRGECAIEGTSICSYSNPCLTTPSLLACTNAAARNEAVGLTKIQKRKVFNDNEKADEKRKRKNIVPKHLQPADLKGECFVKRKSQ